VVIIALDGLTQMTLGTMIGIAIAMAIGTMMSTMHGDTMTAVVVFGNMVFARFLVLLYLVYQADVSYLDLLQDRSMTTITVLEI